MVETKQDFAVRFSRGIKAAGALRNELSPPVSDTVDVMVATVEQFTGKPVGELIAAGAADFVTKAVKQLVKGEVLGGAEGLSLSNEVGELVDVVPMISGAIGLMMDQWEQGIATHARNAQKQNASRAQDCYSRYGRTRNNTKGTEFKKDGTGRIVSPADLFRPLAEQVERNVTGGRRFNYGHMPLNVASMFACLCGPEARGWGWNAWSRERYKPSWEVGDTVAPATSGTSTTYTITGSGRTGYNQWLAYARNVLSKKIGRTEANRLGIPPDVQRKMWLIIEGIMAASRPFRMTKGGVSAIGDQGRVLYPVLLDIVYNQWQQGRWNRGFIRGLQNAQLGCYEIVDARKENRYLSPIVDLSADLIRAMEDWQLTLFPVSEGDYMERARQAAANKPKLTRILFSPGIANKLVKTAAFTRSSSIGTELIRRDRNKKAAIATSAVVGAGAFWAMRRRAKMSR